MTPYYLFQNGFVYPVSGKSDMQELFEAHPELREIHYDYCEEGLQKALESSGLCCPAFTYINLVQGRLEVSKNYGCGPVFPGKHYFRSLLHHLKLHSCNEEFPLPSPCSEYFEGNCCAPCFHTTVSDYAGKIKLAKRTLYGEKVLSTEFHKKNVHISECSVTLEPGILVIQRGHKIVLANKLPEMTDVELGVFLFKMFPVTGPKEVRMKHSHCSRLFCKIRNSGAAGSKERVTTKRALIKAEPVEASISLPELEIDCIDAAHISGSDMVVAAVRYRKGEFMEPLACFYECSGEIESIKKFVSEHLQGSPAILVDGGKQHLNSVKESFTGKVLSISKPPGKHKDVMNIFSENSKNAFDPSNPEHRLYRQLRDEAHELANQLHRLARDTIRIKKPYKTVTLKKPEFQLALR